MAGAQPLEGVQHAPVVVEPGRRVVGGGGGEGGEGEQAVRMERECVCETPQRITVSRSERSNSGVILVKTSE